MELKYLKEQLETLTELGKIGYLSSEDHKVKDELEYVFKQFSLNAVLYSKNYEVYKSWKIEKGDYDYYEATNLADCDAFMKHAKTIDEIKAEIDQE